MKTHLISMLIVITLCSCSMRTPAELSAIERCKNMCNYPKSFHLENVRSFESEKLPEWKIDTVFFFKGKERLHSKNRKPLSLTGYIDKYGGINDNWDVHYPKFVKYDSIAIFNIGNDTIRYITIYVDFSAKNAFGMESSKTEIFYAKTKDDFATHYLSSGWLYEEKTFLITSEKMPKVCKTRNTHEEGYYYL